eukprot:TRINITY_DN1450_c0_g1_i4.p2 TRINITY_DN1450_c0_g1~~TRINITY_DN1450_c0_g1_i4.p2  ORF type:complete len:113 (-),score=20.28 TRINITY_DN1450_c0_g1_i4:521-859(-)
MDLIQDRGVDERERAGDHQWDFIIEEFEQDSDHNLHHYMYHADNFITEIDPFHRGNEAVVSTQSTGNLMIDLKASTHQLHLIDELIVTIDPASNCLVLYTKSGKKKKEKKVK